MQMTKEEFDRESRYQVIMHFVRKMLTDGLITEGEYHQIDTKYREKFLPIRNKGELPRYYVENNHDPIVSREVWQAVQDKIRDAREYNPTAHRIVKPSVFSGKIICGKCGQNYTKGQARISKADGLKEIWV